MQKKFVIGITWDPRLGFRFAEELSKASGADVEVIGAAFPKKQPRLVKYIVVWPLYIWVSIRLFGRCWRADRVICWQQAYGVTLGFFARVLQGLGVNLHAKIDVLTFILTPNKRKGVWIKILDFAISAKAVDRVVVYNIAEYECYRALFPRSKDKFAYTLYPAADVPAKFIATSSCEDFYLAVGRSNRDHEYLRDYFLARPNRRCVVLTDQALKSQSDNFHVISGVFGEAYFEYLKKCRAVIIPFYDSTVSAGQLVYLQAVQLGKPVLVSRSRCLEGYVLDGETGLFFDKTHEGLDKVLNSVEVADWYGRVSHNCLIDYPKRFGFVKLAESYCSIINGASIVD